VTRPLVFVDLLFFTGTKGGMESYVREVYSRLSPDDPDLRFVAYASKELAAAGAPWFPGEVLDSGISGEDRVAWARGELFAVDRAARRAGAALVHAPANFGPALPRVPVVVTVHDLLAFRHPEYVPGAYARIVKTMVRRIARVARRVLTISEATRDDLVRLLSVPADRIDVVPLAGSAGLEAGAHEPEAVERRGDLLLSVGNRMPHKNFERLLEALALLPEARRPTLVITGSHGDDPLRPVVERLGLARWVQLRGWLERDELERLYAEATALVFPTLFEGFGLPTLEAMSRGCPVICSDLPVMREVGGDAAVYVDPNDPAAIANAIETLLADDDARERMSRAGVDRATRFSWQRTADGTREGLLKALGS
jgi:glycosyltransferase involved in cell wall biosynthesis